MMISAEMLASFAKVAETLSVGRSAIALKVTKSVVSKRIAQLEAHLGVTLFSRSTRRIVLTSAGEIYLEHARRALAELHAAEELLLASRSEIKGPIRITAPVSWGQRVLCKLLPEFLKMHPGIQIELTLADRMVDIAFERFDLALRWSASLPKQDLVSTPIAKIDWLLTASPSYLALQDEPKTPEDLAHHSTLFYWREPSDQWWVMSAGQSERRIPVKSRYHVDNPEAVLEACLQGLGIAQLPDYLCAQAISDGQLRQMLPGWIQQTRFGNLITALAPPERMRNLRNRLLIDFLSQSGVANPLKPLNL